MANVNVSLEVKTGSSEQNVGRVTGAVNSLSQAVHRLGGTSARSGIQVRGVAQAVFAGNAALLAARAAINAAAQGFRDLTQFLGSSIQASIEQQQAIAKLDAVFRSTGVGTTAFKEQVLELSAELQRTMGVADEVGTSIQATLISMGANSSNIERVTKASLDLATALGGDVEKSAMLLGKAMAGSTQALGRYGIQVDRTKPKVEQFEQALKQIEIRFGGQALAAAQTFGGQLKILEALFGDFQETIGNVFTESKFFLDAIGLINEGLVKAGEFVTRYRSDLEDLAQAGFLALADIIPFVVKAFGFFLDILLRAIELSRLAYQALKAIADLLGPNGWIAIVTVATGAVLGLGYAMKSLALASLGLPGVLILAVGSLYEIAKATGLVTDESNKVDEIALLWEKAQKGIESYNSTLQDSLGGTRKTREEQKQAVEDLLQRAEIANKELRDAQVAEQALRQQKGIASMFDLGQDTDFDKLNRDIQLAGERTAAARDIMDQLADKILMAGLEFAIAQGGIDAGLQDRINKLYEQRDLLGKIMETARIFAAGNRGEIGPQQPGKDLRPTPIDKPGKESDQDRARKQLREKIADLKTEIEITEKLLRTRESLEFLDQKIDAAKLGRKANEQELAKEYERQAIAQAKLSEKAQLRQSIEKQNRESIEETIPTLQAQLAAVQALNPALATEAEINDALAIAEKEVALQRAYGNQVAAEFLENEKRVLALRQQLTTATDEKNVERDIALLKQELELKKQVLKGTISQAQADLALAAAKAAANGASAELAVTLQALQQQLEKLDEQIEATQIDLKSFFSDAVDTFVDGLLLGTNKSVDAMEAMANLGKAFFADMFKKILLDKFAFDGQFQANFLRDLPSFAKDSANSIADTFSQAFSAITGSANDSSGSILSSFSSLGGSLLQLGSGLLGGGAVAGGLGTASAAAAAGSIAGTGFGAGLTTIGGLGVVPATAGLSIAGGATLAGTSTGAAILGGTTAATAGAGAAGAAGTAAAGLGSLAGGAATAGILLAVIAAAMAGSGIYNLNKQPVHFDENSYVKSLQKSMGVLGKIFDGIGRIATFGQLDFATGFRGAAKLYNGTSLNAREITQLIFDPVALALGAFIDIPTKGTVLRKHFEEFIEDKDLGAGFFARDSGTFQRGIGQEGTREILRTKFPDDAPGDFVLAMREYIDLQKDAIGLNDEQLKQFVGLGVAFRSIIGKKAGHEEQRSLAIVADLLGSIAKEGASAEEAMEIVGKAIEGLGDPRQFFRQLNDFFTSEDNDIAVEDYKVAVQGLAEAIFRDVPAGVRPALIALEEFKKDGVVTFEELKERVEDLTLAVSFFSNPIKNLFTNAALTGDDKLTNRALEDAFFEEIKSGMQAAVFDGVRNAFVAATLQGGPLEAFAAAMKDALLKINSGELTGNEGFELIRQAGAEAVEGLKEIRPYVQEIINFSREISDLFGESEDSIISLATALARLEEQQRIFNSRLGQRIAQLRGENQRPFFEAEAGLVDQEIANLRKEFFPSITDAINAPKGDRERLARRAAGLDIDVDDQIAALQEMETLIEKSLSLRIEGIQAELELAQEAHDERMEQLNDQREAIQDQYDAEIELREKQIDALEEALEIAEQWLDVSETLADTILDIQTGGDSAFDPRARFSILQREFDRVSDIFNNAGSSEQDRIDAANRLAELGPELLGLAGDAGFAQGSEEFRLIFGDILNTLQNAQTVASANSKNVEEMQDEVRRLTEEIRDLDEERNLKLDAIDQQIDSAEKAMRDLEKAATKEIKAVQKAAAGQLEWLQGKGNEIFQKKQDELKQKLEDIGATNVDLEDISFESYRELYRIRQLIEEQGGRVFGSDDEIAGQFGLTRGGQQQIESQLSGKKVGDTTYQALERLQGARTFEDLSSKVYSQFEKDIAQTIRTLFTGIGGFGDFQLILEALKQKIANPDVVQPILGFAGGGLVRRPQRINVGEGGNAELILPLSRAMQDPEVRKMFGHTRQDYTRELVKLTGRMLDETEAMRRAIENSQVEGQRVLRSDRSETSSAGSHSGVIVENLNLTLDSKMTVDGLFDFTSDGILKQLAAPLAQMVLKQLQSGGLFAEEMKALAKNATKQVQGKV